MKPSIFSFLTLFILITVPAYGQFTNPYTGNTFNNPMPSTIDTMVLFKARELALERHLLGKTSDELAQENQANPPEPDFAATSFQPLKEPILPQEWVAGMGELLPEERKQIVEFCMNLLASYDNSYAQHGQTRLRHNVAAAYANLIYAANVIRTGQELSEPQLKALVRQLHLKLSADPKFTGLSDPQKQKTYEAAVINTGLMLTFQQQFVQSGEQQFAQTAQTLAKDTWTFFFGPAADRVSFTDQGAVAQQ